MRLKSIKPKGTGDMELGNVTVLVGPNNVGKSQTLRDLYDIMTPPRKQEGPLIESVMLEKPPSFEDLLTGITVDNDPHNASMQRYRAIGPNLRQSDSLSLSEDRLKHAYDKAIDGNFTLEGNAFSRFHVAHLDAEPRLLVVKKGPGFNMHEQRPENLLQSLYAATDEDNTAFGEAFHEIFGMQITLDYSGMTEWVLRIAPEFPAHENDPKKAYPILTKFPSVDEQGDGYRSCAAVLLSVLLFPHRIILLDEPDAFLHPAQAKKLGTWISKKVNDRKGQVLIATHSASFLSGLVSAGGHVDVFRLNRHGDNYTSFTKMPSGATKALSHSPLLSSQRVTEAVFHHGVCVCEADADRAFYQTAAEKFFPDQQVFYVHAQNKQTVATVAGMLREAKIPVCAVVDIDILSSVGEYGRLFAAVTGDGLNRDAASQVENIGKQVEGIAEDVLLAGLTGAVAEFSGQLERREHDLAGAKGALNRLKKHATKWAVVKAKGIEGLPKSIQSEVKKLLDDLRGKGVFIVPVGELEGWIALSTTRKNKWIVEALKELNTGVQPPKLKEFIGHVSDFLALANS